MQRKRHSRIPRSNKKWMHFLKHKKLVDGRDIRRQLRLDAEHFFNVSDGNDECAEENSERNSEGFDSDDE